MDKQLLKTFFLLIAALLLAGLPVGCKKPTVEAKSEPASKEIQAPAEPIAAQSAFQQMYRPVREWAPDALPLSLVADAIPGIKNEGGKAGMWTGVFVSPSKRSARTVFYSVAEHGTFLRGVTLGGAQGWSGATAKSKPFNPTEFLVNSDEAYKTAIDKAGAWVKRNPEKKLSLYLASASRGSSPVWIFMWGDTKSGYLAYVNAYSGKIVPGR